MESARVWDAAAAESCIRGSRAFKIWQRSGSPVCLPSSPASSIPPRNEYFKLMNLDCIYPVEERCSPTICQVLIILLSITMLTSALILIQSLRSNQALCLVPRTSIWSSSQQLQSTFQDESAVETEIRKGFKPNDKAWLLKQTEENGTTSCDQVKTEQAFLFGFHQPSEGNISLQTNQHHVIKIVSYTKDGIRRCKGGDFYETDLSGPKWKSRPPVKDLGDGAYLVDLMVDSRMVGIYTFKVVLLFSNLHGLDKYPDSWNQSREILQIQIEFVDLTIDPHTNSSSISQSELHLCTPLDFKRSAWRGRWTRSAKNDSCAADASGRFRCLDPNEQCVTPWCQGPLGRLESNGWVYSAHCAFRLFTQEEGWDCLKGRWLFFWGDSNHQDTIRNLLNFILGRHDSDLWRTFTATYINPQNSSEILRITSVFNGHYDERGNNLGLSSLQNSDYRRLVQSHFLPTNEIQPDTVILNSGLHDGKFWPSMALFAEGVRNASHVWESIWRNVSTDTSRRPKLVFRTTVAPAGVSRGMPANPQKMDAFNTILAEELMSTFSQDTLKIVDAYDMSFPWHYDNMCSDGGHYGRPPSGNPARVHQYFVDVMLAHVLLNAICPT